MTAEWPGDGSLRALRVLIVEDDPVDADLIVRELQHGGYDPTCELVADEDAYVAALDRPVDIVLSDYSLPRFNVPRALDLLRERRADVPLIVITGTIGEETAAECIKQGAVDYLMKDRLGRLGASVTRALEQRRLRESEQHAEGALAASELRYRAIVDNALEAILVADDAGRYTEANPAACQLTGYSREELVTMSVWDLTPTPDVEQGRALWQRFVRDGKASGEYRLRRRDGVIIDIEFRSVANAMPGMHVAACRDISARKLAERSQSQLAAIVAASNDAIVGMSLDGTVTAWNQGAERIYGYAAREMIGRSISVLFPPEAAGEFSQLLARLRRGERREGQSSLRLAKGGRQLDIAASVFPVTDGGAVVGAAMIARDMTEILRQQREVSRSEKLRALGQLAGGVAHDLNQSLALILGYGELLNSALADHALDASPLSEMAALITQAARDGGDTVKRLLTFARSEPDAPHEPVDVPVLLQEVARLTAPRWRDSSQIEGRTIRLAIEAEPSISVMGVPHLLREALINLVFNSVDALPQGGTITLSCRRDGGDASIRVADTGVGIGAQAQGHIFEPFFTTKGERGSGLGLPLVYSIVESHGGSIRVESELGRGTTMLLRFPLARAAAPPPEDAAPPPDRPESLRILAIDDEPAVAALTARMLQHLGHEVTTEHSGEAGLVLLADRPYDVVISDIGLGDGMNGWQFVEQIRARNAHLPVILATGWGAAIGPEETARLGPCTVVPKPYRIGDLERALAAMVAH